MSFLNRLLTVTLVLLSFLSGGARSLLSQAAQAETPADQAKDHPGSDGTCAGCGLRASKKKLKK